MTDYSKMDNLILESIAYGAKTFSTIDNGDVYREAQRLQDETGGPAFRIIDRRLQALRKKGLIQYTTKEKWSLV
jgi:hypothetical protein